MGKARLIFAAWLALAALAPFGSPASASPATGARAEVRQATLVAGGGGLLSGLNLQLRAKLTDTETGAPLVGQRVDFYVGNELLPATCSATTNASGVARCGGLSEFLWLLQEGTFRAHFFGGNVGDAFYFPTSDSVSLLGP